MSNHYRKKPVVVEAFQMTEARRMDNSEWPEWLHDAWNKPEGEPGALFRQNRDAPLPDLLCIQTLEGVHLVTFGDWIIRGVAGELYPCKPDIFAATYESVALTQAIATTERKGEPVYQICMADSVSISTAWVDVGKEAYDDAGLYPEYRRRTLYTSPQVPEGFALVPVEPTPEMKSAGIKVEVYSEVSDSIGVLTWGEVRAIYRAMLDAARKGE